MDTADLWDSDKENRDPTKGTHKTKRTRKGKKPKPANYPTAAASIEYNMKYQHPDEIHREIMENQEIEDYIQFMANSDNMILQASSSETVKAYRHLFNTSFLNEDNGNNYEDIIPAKGETARWWKMLVPGYNTKEIWSITWRPERYPDYMERRWDVAHQFMQNEKERTEAAERRRTILSALYNGEDPQAGFLLNLDLYRVNKPSIPTVLPPIYRVCPLTGNWYPTEAYHKDRDPFIVGFDVFYNNNTINKIFRFDSLATMDKITYTKEDVEEQRQKMNMYTDYNIPYCLGNQIDPDKPEIILTPIPYVAMGSRGPWRMIPTDVVSDEIREARARKKLKLQNTKAHRGNRYTPETTNRNPGKFRM